MTRRRLTRCTLLALLIFAALPAAASAYPVAVNTTADTVDPGGNWSLREALDSANSNAGGNGCAAGSVAPDAITLPAGH